MGVTYKKEKEFTNLDISRGFTKRLNGSSSTFPVSKRIIIEKTIDPLLLMLPIETKISPIGNKLIDDTYRKVFNLRRTSIQEVKIP